MRVRRHHAQEIWRQARRDYEEGGFTAPVVAAWYGASVHAVKRRARVEGWSKIVRALPAALFETGAEAGECGEDAACAWERIAHEAQRAPEGNWSTWLFQGGRGAGKTRAGAEWLAARAERVALVGPTQHDVREVMVDGPSGMRNLPGRSRPHYERSRRRLLWANGSVAYAFSAEEPERLRGPQFGAAWADDRADASMERRRARGRASGSWDPNRCGAAGCRGAARARGAGRRSEAWAQRPGAFRRASGA